MNRIARLAVCMFVTATFLGSCITLTAGDVSAKGKPPGGPEDPVMYFNGYVVDSETFAPLDGIWVECFYKYPGGQGHDVTMTSKGFFKLTPMRVSRSLEYNFFVGTDMADGYWIEHRVQYLPSVEQRYYLIKDHPGYIYPFAAFGNTPDVESIDVIKETEVQSTYDSEIGAGAFGIQGFIHYTRGDITTWTTGGHGGLGQNLQRRVPYMMSGEFHYNTKTREYSYERTFPVGNMLPAGPEWGSYFDDPYKNWDPSQFIGATLSEWWDPGTGPTGSHSDGKVTGWEKGVNVAWSIPFFDISVWGKISWSHTTIKTDTVSFRITNTDIVPHKYWIYWEGDILHVWRSNEVYPLPWP